ncbi:MAG: hypothetical protein LBN05_00090 [Oscillospiraceae bacterium]|jgi:hypothetical protein|nr:hypothetical protein [Oscillospiraceae bacterium]
MFRLIKNEIKSTAHSMTGIYLATGIAIAVMALTIQGMHFHILPNWVAALGLIISMVAGLLLFLLTMIVVLVNFSKSLYGAEGYLSFALPVSGGRLLGTKTIVSVIWMFSSYILSLLIEIGIMVYTTQTLATGEVMDLIKQILPMFVNMPNPSVLILAGVFMGLSFFLTLFMIVADVFFATTAANTRPFQKNARLWTILLSAAVLIPTMWISTRLTNDVPLTFMLTAKQVGFIPEAMSVPNQLSTYLPQGPGDWGIKFGVVGILFELPLSALLLYFTSYMMNHKTNVK